jgi:hypothetical protein
MPDLPPPTLRDLFKFISISEAGIVVPEIVRQLGPLHPALENHRALPIIRHFVGERWGTELDRQTYFRFRDLICAKRELTPFEAEELPLDEVVAVVRVAYMPDITGYTDDNRPRLDNPYRDLLHMGQRAYQDEWERAALLAGKRRQSPSEWGRQMQARVAELSALVDTALCAAERTGFPFEEVERRVKAFAGVIRSILFWQRDAPTLSPEERERMDFSGIWRDPGSGYLSDHYCRMQAAWDSIHVLAIRADRGNTDSGPETHEVPLDTASARSSPLRKACEVDHWRDLGIGFDGEWRIFAFVPCPKRGEYISISNAIHLELPGIRWRKVLELLARSEDGRTARISELVTELGYMKKPRRSISHEQAEFDEHLVQKAKRAKDALRNTMADLGRELRRQVTAEKNAAVFRAVSDSDYQAAFTAGYLIRDKNEKTKFSWGTNP